MVASSPENDDVKAKKVKKDRSFTMTWFDYPDTVDTLIPGLVGKDGKWCFQHEVCPETGRPHIQGVVWFKNARTFAQVHKLFPGAHIEKCKSWKASIEYCSKEWTRGGKEVIENCLPEKILDPLDRTNLADWMVDVEALMAGPVHPRMVYWFWSSEGSIGKSFFIFHHCLHNKRYILVDGDNKDILCGIQKMKESPKVVFWNIAADDPEPSYRTMEKVKDGMFFATKYESGMCLMNKPHVIVFANRPPNKNKLKLDRWSIHEI